MTRRLTATILAVVAFATVLSLPADAAGDRSRRPSEESHPCADIIGNGVRYDAELQTSTFYVLTSEPSCRRAVFTFVLFDEEDSRRPLNVLTSRGNGFGTDTGINPVPFSFQVEDESDAIYCTVATSHIGRHLVDRAPDEGRLCFPANTNSDLGRGRSFR